MQKQEFVNHVIDKNIDQTNLRKIMVPICESNHIDSVMIYDYRIKDIMYLIKSFTDLNHCNEQEEFFKVFKDNQRDYILNFETKIPALAIIYLDTLELKYSLTSSDYFNVGFVLNIFSFFNSLEDRIHNMITEYKKVINKHKNDLEDVELHDLYVVYKNHYSKCSMFDLKTRKKFRNAMSNYKNASRKEQERITLKETTILKEKIKVDTQELHILEEELASIQSCKAYMNNYMMSYKSQYNKICQKIINELGVYYGE